MDYKKGDKVVIVTAPIVGMRATVVAVSRATGGLTVIAFDEMGAYKRGTMIHVNPYEVRRES